MRRTTPLNLEPLNPSKKRCTHAMSTTFFLCLQSPHDRSSADEPVTVVEDDGLAAGDGALGFFEFHDGTAVSFERHGAVMDADAVADLGLTGKFLSGRFAVCEVKLVRQKAGAEEFVIRANDDLRFLGL